MPVSLYKQVFLASSALVRFAAAQDDDEPQSDTMGPAAFMWPPDRVWSAAADNNAPCGSIADPSNRTEFPLENGQIALVAQDESWEIELGIAYSSDPQSNDDFTTLIDAEHFREMDVGHTCVPISNAPTSVSPGENATLQIRYTANFDNPQNETFYACADITFVEARQFTFTVPCFNATEPENEDGAGGDWDYHGDDDLDDDDEDADDSSETSSGPTSSSTAGSEDGDNEESNEDSNEGGSSGGSSGLGGGAIAGIVVGVVGGLALIGVAGLLFYRRRQKQLMATRQQNTSRGVKWEERDNTTTNNQGGSVSSDSVRMQNLSP